MAIAQIRLAPANAPTSSQMLKIPMVPHYHILDHRVPIRAT
ncbi:MULTISPECIES: hypothetical protein [unclassified Mesorhizobium]|nr:MULTISPECIES: hypothetical protein [unclassified Mesorhizobium]ESY79633.1 hypothetical protein X739_30430 [Mesorhizobium sp. LNHC220B00]ESY90055.1 hypothetical protein X738_30905 [Mesorhizobium sp. LNHC209A00]